MGFVLLAIWIFIVIMAKNDLDVDRADSIHERLDIIEAKLASKGRGCGK